MVFSELEGLKSSKKEKTSQNAEEATQFIIQNNIRFLTTSGKLLAGKIFNFQILSRVSDVKNKSRWETVFVSKWR